jgi:hypothetical protein
MFDLPEKILLENYNGDWQKFENAVYEAFYNDFVKTKPIYRNIRLGLKKYPLIDGKEYTFYHFVTEGKNENQRIQKEDRMERIRWPKPIIVNSYDQSLLVWKNKRGNETRILIWHQQAEYLVVLSERTGYILPWTAYSVTETNRKKKLLKEYEAYKNAKTVQVV